MAKKKTTATTTSSNYPIVKICAFVGLLLAGVAGIITFILNLLGKCGVHIDWGSRVSGICSLIAQIAVYVSVWLAAWDYVKGKGKTWKVLYLIFFILSLLGLVGFGIGGWLS